MNSQGIIGQRGMFEADVAEIEVVVLQRLMSFKVLWLGCRVMSPACLRQWRQLLRPSDCGIPHFEA